MSTPVVTHQFDATEVRLSVHEWGGDGPPVLLAHATGFHGMVWGPLAARLVAAGRRVFSFDFRGHGDSDAPDSDYSWHGFADDVLAVADHLGVARDPALVACGHSKGGAALLLAEQKLPGTFRRIWAYEPILFASEETLPPKDDFFLARAARKRRNEWTSTEEAIAAYSAKAPLDVMTPDSMRAYVEYGLRDRGDGVLVLKCRPEVEAQVFSMAPNNGAYAHLGEVDAEVLIVCGEISTSVDPALGARIADALPHGRLEVLAGLGHFGPQQDPDACAASIVAFTG
ncbi:MAG TPA: alpha/beta hydrolase [Acidimicrobiia bacterium]|nr:alpha/beta hydrolase [Acidimicrobiia bacterium]